MASSRRRRGATHNLLHLPDTLLEACLLPLGITDRASAALSCRALAFLSRSSQQLWRGLEVDLCERRAGTDADALLRWVQARRHQLRCLKLIAPPSVTSAAAAFTCVASVGPRLLSLELWLPEHEDDTGSTAAWVSLCPFLQYLSVSTWQSEFTLSAGLGALRALRTLRIEHGDSEPEDINMPGLLHVAPGAIPPQLAELSLTMWVLEALPEALGAAAASLARLEITNCFFDNCEGGLGVLSRLTTITRLRLAASNRLGVDGALQTSYIESIPAEVAALPSLACLTVDADVKDDSLALRDLRHLTALSVLTGGPLSRPASQLLTWLPQGRLRQLYTTQPVDASAAALPAFRSLRSLALPLSSLVKDAGLLSGMTALTRLLLLVSPWEWEEEEEGRVGVGLLPRAPLALALESLAQLPGLRVVELQTDEPDLGLWDDDGDGGGCWEAWEALWGVPGMRHVGPHTCHRFWEIDEAWHCVGAAEMPIQAHCPWFGVEHVVSGAHAPGWPAGRSGCSCCARTDD